MNPVQEEVMALAINLKRIVSLRLCNEISREHYELRRERLLNDFSAISVRLIRCDELEGVS